jgi:hypothetical protein
MERQQPSGTSWMVLLFLLTALVLRGLGPWVEQAAAAPEATTLADLPLAAQGAVSAALGWDHASYRIFPMEDGYAAENPKHSLAVQWTMSGMEVRTGSGNLGLALEGCGRGDLLVGAGGVEPQADGNRVEYRRGALTEWYERTRGGGPIRAESETDGLGREGF